MKVGDYVRTKYGIAKIIDLKENPYREKTIYVLNKSIINIYDCDGGELACCNPLIEDMQDRFDTKFGDEKCIVKSSPNIIDLIEVGDYVNGHRVSDIYEDIDGQIRMKFGENGLVLAHKSNYDNYYLFEEDIKSIITKEQFKSMKYEVK